MVGKHLGDGGADGLIVGEGSLRKWPAKNEEIRFNFPGKERTSQGQRQCGSQQPGARTSVVWGGSQRSVVKAAEVLDHRAPDDVSQHFPTYLYLKPPQNLIVVKDPVHVFTWLIALGLDSISGNLFQINTDTHEQQTRCPPREHSSTERRWRFLP